MCKFHYYLLATAFGILQMIPILFVLLLSLTVTSPASGAALCYTNAVLPAHVWALKGCGEYDIVTSLSDDGESCIETQLWHNKPLFRREMYVPLNKLYEVYAESIEHGDVEALHRVYLWLRPTPRPFPKFVELLGRAGEEPLSPPQPWGMRGYKKVIKAIGSYWFGDKEISPDYFMAVFFLYSGGEVRPSDMEIETKPSAKMMSSYLFSWLYPAIDIRMREEKKDRSKRIFVRMPR